MKTQAILFTGRGQVGIGEVTLPERGENDVVVETLVTLVSAGTELRLLHHGYKGEEPYPMVPGYSAVGRAVQVGAGFAGLEEGDLVFAGGGNRIASGAQSLWGAHCGRLVMPSGSVWRLAGRVPAELCAFANVAAIALHGVRIAEIEPSERVVVMGLGIIGQLSARNLLARGAEVIGCDLSAERRAVAERIGIRTLDPLAGDLREAVYEVWPEGPDAVFEVTSRTDVIRQAVALLPVWVQRPKPLRFVMQANYTEDIVFGNRDLFDREVTVLSPRNVGPGDVAAAIRMIEAGALKVDDLAPPAVAPQDAPAAYANLTERASANLTAIFDWSAGG